jgi:hypothetical protein
MVPLYATSVGTGGTGVGLVTGALMFSTMAAELATPRLMARFGYRLALGTGVLLLGVLALALPASADMAAIVVVCALRGLGFGITVVVGSALMAALPSRAPRLWWPAWCCSAPASASPRTPAGPDVHPRTGLRVRTASALWNLAYDGGLGLGAAGLGVLAAHTGYPAALGSLPR